MKTKQGISLIVLIITIVVMIILSGTIMLTLNNGKIIDKASDAVEKTNDNTVKELAELGWTEAYMKGKKTVEEYQATVREKLEKHKIDVQEYGIVVTESGVKVAKGWLQDGLTVVKGDTVLEIGTDFEYDETGEGTKNVSWKVLGAENGELLIMSTTDIASWYTLGDSQDLEHSQNDWLNGAAELDSLCERYGKGESATGARSIRIEDVDKITGFDKTTYGKGQIGEYGNKVTYSYNGTEKPDYVGTNGKKGTLVVTYNDGFHFYNGTEFVHVNDLTTGEKGTAFATLKSDCYEYSAPDLVTIDNTSDAYTMLFGEAYYWLASKYTSTNTGRAVFGFFIVSQGNILNSSLWNSSGGLSSRSFGVRAVVSLDSDIQVEETKEGAWTY